ncbi:hypothetical protein NEIRO03_2280, partial [Nematocida sp. AWRm78]
TNEITADKTIADKWDIFVNIRIKVKAYVGSFLYIHVNLLIKPDYTHFIIKNYENTFLTIDSEQLSNEIRNSRNLLGEPMSEQYICASYLFNTLYPSACFTGINTFQKLEAYVTSIDTKNMIENCVCVTQLFISRKLSYNAERFTLARNLLIFAYTRQLDKTHYSLEVIRALFRSIDPEDEFTQKRILSIIKITNFHTIYPDVCIGIDKEKLLSHPRMEYMDIEVILIFLATEQNPEKLYNVTLNYLNMNESHVSEYIDALVYSIPKELVLLIMRCLTDKYKSIQYISKIMQFILGKKIDLYIDFVFYLIESATNDGEFNVDRYVLYLYDRLAFYTYYDDIEYTLGYFSSYFRRSLTIEYLWQKKFILCKNNSQKEKSMFQSVISAYRR